MEPKIAIIGGGLFGITIYLKLQKKGYQCFLFEKKKSILKGASSNNLNRVHLGYHYPRDFETARQSLKGYKNFKKFYSSSIVNKFKNYYFIANSSKVNIKNYLKFCKLNNLNFKKVNLNSFFLENKYLQGGIKVKEPVYDWEEIKKNINNKLKEFKTNKIFLNKEVLKILYNNNKYILKTKKNSHKFDIVIDASYEGSNKLLKDINKQKKFIFQKVIVFEFTSKNFDKMGLALMDGNYFSFLPKGNTNKHILYHVEYSVLKKTISNYYPQKWYKKNLSDKLINNIRKKIIKDINKYFPNLNLKFTNQYFVSARVFPINLEKTDKRVSKVIKIKKGYYKILSAKVDHCVDIANQMLQCLKAYK